MEISSFQDSEHNLNGTPDMAYSKFGPKNYDELNRFTGSLTYSIWRFIFYVMAQRGGGAWHPLNTLLVATPFGVGHFLNDSNKQNDLTNSTTKEMQ